MDLHSTLPDFPTRPYAHILPSLEKAKISVKELLISDALEIAKQAKVPVTDVRSLATQILAALHKDLGLGVSQGDAERSGQDTKDLGDNDSGAAVAEIPGTLNLPELSTISTLDPVLDAALAGGISTGYVTEISGESGSGKTQFLLHLLLAVQLPAPHGFLKSALYVSTEADLPTGRLSQLLEEHPHLSTLPPESRPSLENILSITTVDLETQDHVLNYQIPVAVSRYNIGLVVIDSVTANYRAESSTENVPALLARAWQLKRLGHFLRALAVKENIAIVVANQVSDRFDTLNESLWTEDIEQPPSSYLQEQQNQMSSSQPASSWHPGSQPVEVQRPAAMGAFRSSQLAPEFSSSPPVSSHVPVSEDVPVDNAIAIEIPELSTVLSLEHQQPFLDGWGGSHASALEVSFSGVRAGWKAPALGLVWTNQIACRIVLKVENILVGATLPAPREAVLDEPPSKTAPDQGVMTRDGEHPLSHSGHAVGNAEQGGANLREEGNYQVHSNEESLEVRARPLAQQRSDRTPTASPERRRKRTMHVVFSPWTSGDPHASPDDDSDGDETVTEGGIGPVEFDPTASSVEFEILPGGIRGRQIL